MKWSPLHVAIYKEHRDIAVLLLERGANTEILARSNLNQTALYMASSRGLADVVRLVIDSGEDLNAICNDYDDGDDDTEWTPLHAAIHKGHLDVAILLLERGADTEIRSSLDETALHVASDRGCAEIVQQLISHGADLNAECHDFDDYFNDVEWTPLHVASRDGTPSIAKMLLEHGANPDHFCRTALHVASSCGNITVVVVESLLEYGTNVDAGHSPSRDHKRRDISGHDR